MGLHQSDAHGVIEQKEIWEVAWSGLYFRGMEKDREAGQHACEEGILDLANPNHN